MMSCQETIQPACYETRYEPTTATTGPMPSLTVPMSNDTAEPRMVEILTVLNDVFDSFGISAESAIRSGAWQS